MSMMELFKVPEKRVDLLIHEFNGVCAREKTVSDVWICISAMTDDADERELLAFLLGRMVQQNQLLYRIKDGI